MQGSIISFDDSTHELRRIVECSCCGHGIDEPAPSWCEDHHVAPYVPPVAVMAFRHVTADTITADEVEQVRRYVWNIPLDTRTAKESGLLAACDDAGCGSRAAKVAVAMAWNCLWGAR